ncbi:MAG: homoserine dehydrogenase [Nitrospinae bacterium]|nr:homoserine dehydrogenase [Nitrospinota bacterium]
MIAKREIRVGLIGFGVVGRGVARLLATNGPLYAARIGAPVTLAKVAVRDLTKLRPVTPDPSMLTDDPFSIVNDPTIDIVIEVMGGEEPARSLILAALANGKGVVTANKALLAIHGEEIYAAAEAGNAPLRFEAAVGGVIPIVRTLNGAFAANKIDTVYGIVNGTCNYILSRMAEEGLGFEEILKDAQALGYAEADPTFDVEGIDAAHKMAILAALAFETPVDFNSVHMEGITRVSALDIRTAAQLGYVIKLIGVARRHNDTAVEVRVTPSLVPEWMPIASVNGALNAIEVSGPDIGDNLLVGPGAGQGPTASAVLGDVAVIARTIVDGAPPTPRPMNVPVALRRPLPALPLEKIESRYYLRFDTYDRPGVMAQLTRPLGDHGISIASMMQKEKVGKRADGASVVVVTHWAMESDLRAALAEIEGADILHCPTVVMRIIGDEEDE